MKKFLSLLLVMMMTVALCVPAMADEPAAATQPTGAKVTITSENNPGAQYEAYRLLDLTTSLKCDKLHTHNESCGEEGAYTCGKEEHTEHTESCYAYAYTVNNDYKDILLEILEIDEDEDVPANKTLDDVVYEKMAATDFDARAFANAVITKINSAKASDSTAYPADAKLGEGKDKGKKIDQGYWLIADVTASPAAGVTRSLVMLATDGQKDITIKAKDSKSTFTKTVDTENSFIGQTKTFTLKYTLPANLNAYKDFTYKITDQMPVGLTYTEGSMEIKVSTNPVSTYNETTSPVTVTAATATAGQKLTIDLSSWINSNKDDFTVAGAANGAKGYDITITYGAVVNDDAVIDYTGNKNIATLTFTNDPDVGGTGTIESNAVVKTYAIAIQKVDDKQNPLAGAEFRFPFYVKKEAASDGAYIYAYSEEDYNKLEDEDQLNAGVTNTLTTPESGLIVVKGVQSGVKYTIKEIKAPDGYNKLADDVEVTATPLGEEKESTSTTVKFDENGNVATSTTTGETTEKTFTVDIPATLAVVVNHNGTELPSTGGIGTTIFYAVGGVLMAGAAILLITKKKMSNGEK